MIQNQITPKEVAIMLNEINAPYGKNYEFPSDIDTSECERFFGIRCPYNVHITDKHIAHIDEFNPRYKLLKHIEELTSIPPAMTIIFGIIGIVGLTALLSKTFK